MMNDEFYYVSKHEWIPYPTEEASYQAMLRTMHFRNQMVINLMLREGHVL